jgi:hypothetical protein
LDFEIWAPDQANSAPNQTAFGVKGGFLYIWDSTDLEQQGSNATPKPCGPSATQGPCDLLDVFPQALAEYRQDGTPTGKTLESSGVFGRCHGVLGDHTGRYVNVNMFVPGGGYIGVMDTQTKEAIGLFRVTEFNTATGRSVHMSVWSDDGSAILISNLHGKAIERINVERDSNGTITKLSFDTSATLGLGKALTVTQHATVFLGPNEHGNNLIGEIVGSYDNAGLGDLTPTGACKENGCVGGSNGIAGGRGNNVPICALPSSNNNVYITLGGGGLLVADLKSTPMSIVGEYGSAVVYGAGCGGVQAKGKMYLNSGISASGAGATQSLFALFSFQDDAYPTGADVANGLGLAQNTPMPVRVFQDKGNTASNGNAESILASDSSGQLPGVSTRRDSHGAVTHPSGEYVYVVDRIQNVMEVFNVETNSRTTFDLASATGQDGREGATGPCYTNSVLEDPNLPLNNPTSDLLHITPDGKYLVTALRGPVPVTVGHSGQGSCPGVGVVELLDGGSTGRLLTVLRASNQVPDLVNITTTSFPGGVAYSGIERADVHSVFVVHAPFTYEPPEDETTPALNAASSYRNLSFWTKLASLACLLFLIY